MPYIPHNGICKYRKFVAKISSEYILFFFFLTYKSNHSLLEFNVYNCWQRFFCIMFDFAYLFLQSPVLFTEPQEKLHQFLGLFFFFFFNLVHAFESEGSTCFFSLQVVSDSCNPMDYSPPGSSVHGIFQARILEWLAISFSRGSSGPRV